MANMVRGFLASLCRCREVVVDIPMEEIGGEGANAVQVIPSGCLDGIREVWHGWSLATKVCVVSTVGIIFAGSVLSVGVVGALGLGGAVIVPALTTVTMNPEALVDSVIINSWVDSGVVVSCVRKKGFREVKLSTFEDEEFYKSALSEKCKEFEQQEDQGVDIFEKIKEEGFSLAGELTDQEKQYKQKMYIKGINETRVYLDSADGKCMEGFVFETYLGFIKEAVTKCGFN